MQNERSQSAMIAINGFINKARLTTVAYAAEKLEANCSILTWLVFTVVLDDSFGLIFAKEHRFTETVHLCLLKRTDAIKVCEVLRAFRPKNEKYCTQ